MLLFNFKLLQICTFPHFSPTCFDILSSNFVYDFVLMYHRASLSFVIFPLQFLLELCLFVNLEYSKYTVFRTFLLHAVTYWAEILHMTLFRVPTVLEKSLNFGFSLKSPWKWISPWKVLEFRVPSLKFQLVVLDFLFCVFWTESLNGYSKLRGTRDNFPPKKFGSLRSQQLAS